MSRHLSEEVQGPVGGRVTASGGIVARILTVMLHTLSAAQGSRVSERLRGR